MCADLGLFDLYMQDISYYCCIEVCGDQNDIMLSLSSLFSPETGMYM